MALEVYASLTNPSKNVDLERHFYLGQSIFMQDDGRGSYSALHSLVGIYPGSNGRRKQTLAYGFMKKAARAAKHFLIDLSTGPV